MVFPYGVGKILAIGTTLLQCIQISRTLENFSLFKLSISSFLTTFSHFHTHTLTNPSSYNLQVKTTQPRRYLVRPNQGVVSPGGTETVSILLVERDKQILLHSYDRLGQSALDHSKDKFLVQSCTVDGSFAARYAAEKARAGGGSSDGKVSALSKAMTDELTSMWNSASSSGQPIFNKKLHVRHVVEGGSSVGAGAAAAAAAPAPAASATSAASPSLSASDKTVSPETMSPQQMLAEITSLRRKYDELVSFSVNLTAERDILNNTLEQTKRDLNREMSARAALENAGAGGGGRGGKAAAGSGKKGGVSMVLVLMIAMAAALGGIKLANSGAADFLESVPVLGSALDFGEDDASSGAVAKEEL